MNYNKYEQIFTKNALDSGYSEVNIVKCLKYARPLLERNFPVIYNNSNLASLVGYKTSYLTRAIHFPNYFYKTYRIKKKNGKERIISEPLPSLKEIQNWILINILYVRKNSRYAKAYTPEKTILDNVKYHTNQQKVLCMDIVDFFTSIKTIFVQKIFISFGYSEKVAEMLSRLCCLNGCLPQGAPTSPHISNIYMHSFDNEISQYCNENQIKYTRYADDLTFSGNFNEEIVIEKVNSLLINLGLKINANKTKVMTKNMRQTVTGIIVNEKPNISKEKRKELRQAVFYINKYGIDNHLEKIGCTKSNYLEHLMGIANFCLFINPNDENLKKEKQILVEIYKSGKTNKI